MKKTVLALLLAACLLLTGCNLIEKDAEVDKSTTILSINGVDISKATFTAAYNNYVNQYATYYYYFGSTYDEEANRSEARQDVADSIISSAVLTQKAEELGYTEFSDEEKATIEANAQSTYETDRTSVQEYYFSDTELTGDELTAALDAKMEELGFPLSSYVSAEEQSFSLDKLKADTVKDVAVTDDEIKTQYETNVANYKSSYDSSPASYGSYVNAFTSDSSFAYYAPEGYRYVKRILFKFNDADQTKITDKNTEVTSKQTEITTMESSITALDTTAEDYETQKADYEAQLAALSTELETLKSEYQTLLSNAATGIMDAVDAANARIAAGESFDAVMDELGKDTKLQSEPLKTRGYAVCAASTDLYADFISAAMELKLPGDTTIFTNREGVSIIKYLSEVPAGAVDLSVASDTIKATLLSNKQDEAYSAKTDEWIAAAKIEKHLDRLD